MLTGVFSTLLIKETKQQSLEDISNERQDGFIEGTNASSGVFGLLLTHPSLQVSHHSASQYRLRAYVPILHLALFPPAALPDSLCLSDMIYIYWLPHRHDRAPRLVSRV